MEKTLVQQFLDEVPALVNLCIDYEEAPNEAYKKRLAEAIKSRCEHLPDYDYNAMYDEVSEKIDELSRDNRAEKYVYSLITPFEKYSEAFYGIQIIRLSKESIDQIRDLKGAEGMIQNYEDQIHKTEQRNQMFFDRFHTFDYELDDTEKVFFNLILDIHWYANMLDAALVVNHMDLAKVQEVCGVWIKNFAIKDNPKFRATETSTYIGSFTLAESYYVRLFNNNGAKVVNNEIKEDGDSYPWLLGNISQLQRFSLNDVNFKALYKLLTDDSLGIMSREIPYDYFIAVAQRAQFGVIYNHSDTVKGKFRMFVTMLSRHTTDKLKHKEYVKAASLSMSFLDKKGNIKAENLGKYNVSSDDKFRVALQKIL